MLLSSKSVRLLVLSVAEMDLCLEVSNLGLDVATGADDPLLILRIGRGLVGGGIKDGGGILGAARPSRGGLPGSDPDENFLTSEGLSNPLPFVVDPEPKVGLDSFQLRRRTDGLVGTAGSEEDPLRITP